MRTRGLLSVLAYLLLCSTPRAESGGPDVSWAASDSRSQRLVVGLGQPGRAAPSHEPSAGKADAASACSVSGSAQPDLDLQLTDAEGRPIARFGGATIPLSIRQFPSDPEGKARVATIGDGRLHLEAWVPIRSLRLVLKQDVPIIARHIKALKGTQIAFVGVTGNQIRIAVKTQPALSETFNVTVGCDALTLDALANGDHWSPPGHARGYLMKQPVLPLFDKSGPDAKPVTSIHLATEARGLLLYGDRREGDFIHVLYHHDVAIDGWISAKDLEILPRGEVVDQSLSRYVAAGEKKLQMQAEGHLHRAPAELALYGRADPKIPPIGSVARDAELYVLDVVVGWASVLPKQLDVVPIGDRHFWVRASELGL